MSHTGQGNRLRELGKGGERSVRKKLRVQGGTVSHDRYTRRSRFQSRQTGTRGRLGNPQNVKKRENFAKIFPKRQKPYDAFTLILARKIHDTVPFTLRQWIQTASRNILQIRFEENKPRPRVYPYDGIDRPYGPLPAFPVRNRANTRDEQRVFRKPDLCKELGTGFRTALG